MFSKTESEEKLVAEFRENWRRFKELFGELQGLVGRNADINEIIVKYTELFKISASLATISNKLSKFSIYRNLDSEISFDLSYIQKAIALLDKYKNSFDYDKAKNTLSIISSNLTDMQRTIGQFSALN